MAIITSLKREKKEVYKNYTGDLSKFKFLFEKNTQKNIDRAFNTCSLKAEKRYQNLSYTELEKELQKHLNIFEVKVEEISKNFSNKLARKFVQKKDIPTQHNIESGIKSLSDVKGVKITLSIPDKGFVSRPIFTIPGYSISSSNKNCFWRYLIGMSDKDYPDDGAIKVLDMGYIVGICKVVESCYSYASSNENFIDNPSESYFNEAYSAEDISNMLDISYLILNGRLRSLHERYLLSDCILNISYIQSSISLNEKYKKNINKDYAKSFETKKNIPTKQLSAMRNTNLLKYFSFVELDELCDLKKFRLIESEFDNFYKKTNIGDFLNKSAELRFRRLGQHKATGLYYPGFKCVCVDIGSPSSLIHELGHHIDISIGNELSLHSEFRLLGIEYKKALEATASQHANIEEVEYYKRKRSYFHTPTEMFARCLEIYLVCVKNMTSSFLKPRDSLSLPLGFPIITDKLLSLIDSYFANILTVDRNVDITVKNNHAISSSFETSLFNVASKSNSSKSLNIDEKSEYIDLNCTKSPITFFKDIDIIAPRNTQHSKRQSKGKSISNKTKLNKSNEVQMTLF